MATGWQRLHNAYQERKMMKRITTAMWLAAASLVVAPAADARKTPVATAIVAPTAEQLQAVRDRLPEDEVIYFLLPDRFENGDAANDRGGLKGDRLVTGYDPSAKGFYLGGDLKGLVARLDYLQGMGVTAIWLAPIFKNKPVQGPAGQESAGYHGYWITDFTTIDPHFGNEADFKSFVDAAHARGMKVYMDIITNHSADVIFYRECVGQAACVYRGKGDFPYSRRARDGAAVNGGFAGDNDAATANWAKLTDPAYAYTPFVPDAEKDVKRPAWLNDPAYYHNRGNTTFTGESSTYGDFVGLDDLMTEHPRVVAGMIEIYQGWITRFGIDGYRIDTAKHVNPEFWQQFVPAILATAKAQGIPNFHIFGEVATGDMDPALTAEWTVRAGLPTNLDMPFFAAVRDVLAGNRAPDHLVRLFAADILYAGGEPTAQRLPTFVGNHDFGRFGHFADKAHPTADQGERLARAKLAHAMMFLLRGVPTVYYGDEQGFTGDGNDQDARETMFPSKVAVYNDNDLIGTDATTAASNFDPAHPLYQAVRELAAARKTYAALRYGQQIVRSYDEKPGLLAISRINPADGTDIVVLFNTSDQPITVKVAVDYLATGVAAVIGACPGSMTAPGQMTISLPALGYLACRVEK
jgi:neopullulanase